MARHLLANDVVVRDADYEGHDLVFIVGCPRSGTSWLRRLLASHSMVASGPESYIMEYVGFQLRLWNKQMVGVASGENIVGLPCYLKAEEFAAYIQCCLRSLLAPVRAAIPRNGIFVEKTPAHALYIREIGRLLPEARIVHIIRDARDVVASMLAASRSWASSSNADALQAAQEWVRYVSTARRGGNELGADKYIEVRYEDLVRETRETLLLLSHFLGLKWKEAELNRALERNTPESTRAGDQTPTPLFGEARKTLGPTVGPQAGRIRKAQVGSWHDDLDLASRIKVWIAARHLMRELDYDCRLP